MVDGGYLIPPSENAKNSEIWEETWKRVDRFLPNLYTEIFPEAHPPPGPVPPEVTKNTPPRNEELSGTPEEGTEPPASAMN